MEVAISLFFIIGILQAHFPQNIAEPGLCTAQCTSPRKCILKKIGKNNITDFGGQRHFCFIVLWLFHLSLDLGPRTLIFVLIIFAISYS